MPNLGGWEWVIIGLIALLLFGGSRLGGIGRSGGRAIREFKKEVSAPRPAGNDPAPTTSAAPVRDSWSGPDRS